LKNRNEIRNWQCEKPLRFEKLFWENLTMRKDFGTDREIWKLIHWKK
jgi:hypothetical protein